MKEIIRITNRFKNSSDEIKVKEITKKIEKLINSENKREIA